MEWMHENAELLSALATAIMALAWIFYAQFAIMTYIQQRRPRVVIDQTADHTLNTRFVAVNLSASPVYIAGIIVCVFRDGAETKNRIQNYRRFSGDIDDEDSNESAEDIELKLRHGTLDPGQLFLMGSSSETLSWLLDEEGEESQQQPRGQRLRAALAEVGSFEFRVVAMVGTSDHIVASARSFEIEQSEDGEILIVPADSSTRHYTSWWDRNVAEQWSEELRQLTL